jgi:hypothetical protein
MSWGERILRFQHNVDKEAEGLTMLKPDLSSGIVASTSHPYTLICISILSLIFFCSNRW